MKTFPDVFPIGTKFRPTGKDYICTVVDIHKTFNLAGELIKLEYVSSYDFVSPKTRTDLKTTISRGYIQP